MLVPITFKADGGESSKKGKIRAEDLSALFAFALPSKTGLLDLLNKCDAYDVTASGGVGSFYLHSGYIVICGRIIYIEEATLANIALPSSGTSEGYFGVKVDLSSSAGGECSFFSKTGALVQNDLNQNPVGGVYEFPLYTYTATPSFLSFTNKVAPLIDKVPYSEAATFTAGRDGTVDTAKTIEEKLQDFDSRLTTLGFKSGDSSALVVTGQGITVTSKSISRVGNYIIGKIDLKIESSSHNTFTFNGVTYALLFYMSREFSIADSYSGTEFSGLYGVTYDHGQYTKYVRFFPANTSGTNNRGVMAIKDGTGLIPGTMSIVFGYVGNALEE